MTKKRQAELCDAIILEFYGDKSFHWHELHGPKKLFNHLVKDSDCDKGTDAEAKYFVIQPFINRLLEDGVLQRMDNLSIDPYLSLTDKGNAMLPYLGERGYVTKEKKEGRKTMWVYISGSLVVATFLILIYNTWLKPQPKYINPKNSDTIISPTSTQHSPKLNTDTQLAKSESLKGIDTPTKQLPKPNRQNKKKVNK